MEFSPDDHPSERELKLQIIHIYNKKLDERMKRKRFAIDRGLVDFKKQQHCDRRRTKDERDLVARLRMFAPFHSAEAHEALVEGLVKARRLRQHILLFQQCRRMGIRTLEQVRQFESDRKKREQEMKARKAKENAAYLFEQGQSEGGRGAGATSSSSSSSSRRGRGGAGIGGGDDGEEPELVSLSYGSTKSGNKRKGKGDSNMSVEALANLEKAPGVKMLSEKEAHLCSIMPLLPMHYLAAKEACVREAYRNGRLTMEGMRRVVTLDTPKDQQLYDFFVRESCVVTEPSEAVSPSKKARR